MVTDCVEYGEKQVLELVVESALWMMNACRDER